MNTQAPLRDDTTSATDDRPVKLLCQDVWKVFGEGAKNFLAKHNGAPTSEDLSKAQLVGAVRHASLEVRRGENFIVMGLSGSGKSTLVRCLSRLVEPTWGKIELDGIDLLKASPDELIEIRRHRMGMVFQHFALLPHLTVLENIAFPLSVQGVERKTREARARKVIELVGLSGREQFYPRELSGGQQQRVGIARSLAVEPEIWFLDEPFSALDPLIRREMQAELLRLQSVLKKTIVFITHDFDEAIRLADRVAIMKDGEIIQIGTPEELVLHPATDYVAEFTRDVQRSKVMSAASLMRPVSPSADYGGTVGARDKISSFSARIVGVRKNFLVTAADGRPLGEVTPDDVIDILADRDLAKEARV
ncbi:betaine/proline/choline family ABC transporter ATP-binding protein [Hyphomicrobium sp. B1]|uniref:quaternary amine ABC transporter ATP-binding protein n=1 Tax=unclassified Hyphomicrobium TaxID=2619925 RepID=UPI00391A8C30